MADARVNVQPRSKLRVVEGNRPAPPSFQEMAAFAELARAARVARTTKPTGQSRSWWRLAR